MKSDIDSIYAKGIRLAPDAYGFLESFALEPAILQKILSSDSFMLTLHSIQLGDIVFIILNAAATLIAVANAIFAVTRGKTKKK